MIIRKDYKFYAAHRNEELADKCRNLHGHRYGIACFFEVERRGAVSTLFGDFDAVIEPFLKEEYDHGLMINVHDPLYETLKHHTQRTGECLKMKAFDMPTSVENLALKLFTEIEELGFRLNRLEIRETDTSVVIYTREDWVRDRKPAEAEESDQTPAMAKHTGELDRTPADESVAASPASSV